MSILQTNILKKREKLLSILDPCSASVMLRRNLSTKSLSIMNLRMKMAKSQQDISFVFSTLLIKETPNSLLFLLLLSLF